MSEVIAAAAVDEEGEEGEEEVTPGRPAWMEVNNPFFTGLPVVLMARAVRRLGDEEVTTDDVKCQRIWARVKANRAEPTGRMDGDFLEGTGSLAKMRDLDNLIPY